MVQLKIMTLSNRFLAPSNLQPVLKHPHQSVADWDFLYLSDWSAYTRWRLDIVNYISAPSSLLFQPFPLDAQQYALHKFLTIQDLKAGSIRGWGRKQFAGVGLAYYYIGVTGPTSQGIRLSATSLTLVWRRFRYDWWQGFDLTNEPATLIDAYNWDGSIWVYTSRRYEPPMTGNVNRVGVGCTTQSLGSAQWFDDTEIWRPS